MLQFALSSTAAQVETYCRRLRNGDTAASEIDARRLHESRSLIRHFREDGSGSLTVELPRAELEVVLEALESTAAGLPDDPTQSLFAKDADALVPMTDGPNGTPLSVGRKQRMVPTALKRAILARDRCCVFAECHHQRFLEAHHVKRRADGGETSLDNLLLLCNHHHTLIHGGGFTVQRHVDGRCYFARPDGQPVEVARANRVEESRPLYLVADLPRKMGQPNLPRKMQQRGSIERPGDRRVRLLWQTDR